MLDVLQLRWSQKKFFMFLKRELLFLSEQLWFYFFHYSAACISLLQGKLLYLTCHRKLLLLHQGDGMLLLNCNANNCLWTSTQRKFWSSNCLEEFVCNCCNVQSLLEWKGKWHIFRKFNKNSANKQCHYPRQWMSLMFWGWASEIVLLHMVSRHIVNIKV